MEKPKRITVLYIDDEIHNLNSFKATFRKDFNVLMALSGEDGLTLLKANDIHIVITDQRMPGMSGVQVLAEVMKHDPQVVRVLLTGFTELATITEALTNGLVHYRMEKPWDEQQIREMMDAVIILPKSL